MMSFPPKEMPAKAVTIRDVAEASGFSNATVSLALRDSASISEPTRKLIHEVADKLGYRANPLMAAHWETVRSRKPQGFRSVIAILNDWESAPSMGSSPWLAPVYAALRERANVLGYLTEEFSIAGEDDKERQSKFRSTLRVLRSRGIYAIASLFTAHPMVFVQSLDLLGEFATVFIDAEYKYIEHSMGEMRRMPFHRANADHHGNMLALLGNLKAAGYRRPGFWPNSWDEARYGGESTAAFNFWIQALPKADQLPVQWQKWKIDPPKEEARAQFLKWFPKAKPDVVICQIHEVREWIESMGLKIPGDVGLAHTDLGPPEQGWSGMDARLDSVASCAVDLLTAHLQRNERGVPKIPKDLRVEGCWYQGKTTRKGS